MKINRRFFLRTSAFGALGLYVACVRPSSRGSADEVGRDRAETFDRAGDELERPGRLEHRIAVCGRVPPFPALDQPAAGRRLGQRPALALDEHGWVKRLDPDCWAETPLCTIEGGHYPSGSTRCSTTVQASSTSGVPPRSSPATRDA